MSELANLYNALRNRTNLNAKAEAERKRVREQQRIRQEQKDAKRHAEKMGQLQLLGQIGGAALGAAYLPGAGLATNAASGALMGSSLGSAGAGLAAAFTPNILGTQPDADNPYYAPVSQTQATSQAIGAGLSAWSAYEDMRIQKENADTFLDAKKGLIKLQKRGVSPNQFLASTDIDPKSKEVALHPLLSAAGKTPADFRNIEEANRIAETYAVDFLSQAQPAVDYLKNGMNEMLLTQMLTSSTGQVVSDLRQLREVQGLKGSDNYQEKYDALPDWVKKFDEYPAGIKSSALAFVYENQSETEKELAEKLQQQKEAFSKDLNERIKQKANEFNSWRNSFRSIQEGEVKVYDPGMEYIIPIQRLDQDRVEFIGGIKDYTIPNAVEAISAQSPDTPILNYLVLSRHFGENNPELSQAFNDRYTDAASGTYYDIEKGAKIYREGGSPADAQNAAKIAAGQNSSSNRKPIEEKPQSRPQPPADNSFTSVLQDPDPAPVEEKPFLGEFTGGGRTRNQKKLEERQTESVDLEGLGAAALEAAQEFTGGANLNPTGQMNRKRGEIVSTADDIVSTSATSTSAASTSEQPKIIPTGKVTRYGRPIFENEKGEQYSARYATFQFGSRHIVAPTVGGGGVLLESADVITILRNQLASNQPPTDPLTGEVLPEFSTKAEAEAEADRRTKQIAQDIAASDESKSKPIAEDSNTPPPVPNVKEVVPNRSDNQSRGVVPSLSEPVADLDLVKPTDAPPAPVLGTSFYTQARPAAPNVLPSVDSASALAAIRRKNEQARRNVATAEMPSATVERRRLSPEEDPYYVSRNFKIPKDFSPGKQFDIDLAARRELNRLRNESLKPPVPRIPEVKPEVTEDPNLIPKDWNPTQSILNWAARYEPSKVPVEKPEAAPAAEMNQVSLIANAAATSIPDERFNILDTSVGSYDQNNRVVHPSVSITDKLTESHQQQIEKKLSEVDKTTGLTFAEQYVEETFEMMRENDINTLADNFAQAPEYNRDFIAVLIAQIAGKYQQVESYIKEDQPLDDNTTETLAEAQVILAMFYTAESLANSERNQ